MVCQSIACPASRGCAAHARDETGVATAVNRGQPLDSPAAAPHRSSGPRIDGPGNGRDSVGCRPRRRARRRRRLLPRDAPSPWCWLVARRVGRRASCACPSGPLRIDGLSRAGRLRHRRAASARAGGSTSATAPSSSIRENSLALRVSGLDIRNPRGRARGARAPGAWSASTPGASCASSVQPRSIEFRDLQMTALVHRDGSHRLRGLRRQPPRRCRAASRLPSVDAARGSVSPLSAAVASIFGVVLDSRRRRRRPRPGPHHQRRA